MSVVRRPLTWALAVTVVGLVSSPAAQYGWEWIVFLIGGAAVVATEVWPRPAWRAVLVMAWALDATLLITAGLMFRIAATTRPSGITVLVLCTATAGAAAWAMRDDPGQVTDAVRGDRPLA